MNTKRKSLGRGKSLIDLFNSLKASGKRPLVSSIQTSLLDLIESALGLRPYDVRAVLSLVGGIQLVDCSLEYVPSHL